MTHKITHNIQFVAFLSYILNSIIVIIYGMETLKQRLAAHNFEHAAIFPYQFVNVPFKFLYESNTKGKRTVMLTNTHQTHGYISLNRFGRQLYPPNHTQTYTQRWQKMDFYSSFLFERPIS